MATCSVYTSEGTVITAGVDPDDIADVAQHCANQFGYVLAFGPGCDEDGTPFSPEAYSVGDHSAPGAMLPKKKKGPPRTSGSHSWPRRPGRETTMSTKQRIIELTSKLDGLRNDARYHDLRRTYGDHSPEVLRHLQTCAATQAQGANHT